MKFFLVTTDHFSDRLWFKDDEDFRAAMNYVAVVTILTKVKVLTFILMSNHVHFVLLCDSESAKRFIDTFKKLYGGYFSRKYKVKDYFRRVKVDIREITGEEAVERVIAYVQMNCVAANICASSYFYPWGTGRCFFNDNPVSCLPVGKMSRRAQIRMTRSNVSLPSSFRYCDEGYILPESYVNTEAVEALFRSPKRYNYFLNSSSKAKKILEKDAVPSFRDQNILSSALDLCRSLFRADSIESLNRDQKSELLKQLRRRFGADISQLSRVIGLTYKEAAILLDLV